MNTDAQMEALQKKANLTDPSLVSLPHPKRLEVACFLQQYQLLLGHEYNELVSIIQSNELPYSKISVANNQFPILDSLLGGLRSISGQLDEGMPTMLINYLGFQYCQGRIFETTSSLDSLLIESDIGADIPCRFVRLPFNHIYLKFGQKKSTDYFVSHIDTGHHSLEGMYLSERTVPAKLFDYSPLWLDNFKRCGISLSDNVRVFEAVIVGAAKETITNDSFITWTFAVPDSDMSIEEVLEIQVNSYLNPKINNPLYNKLNQEQRLEAVTAVIHAVKALLYINMGDTAEIHENTEYTDLQFRIENAGPKKKKKLERKLERVFDRVSVGPKSFPTQITTGDSQQLKKMHMRRGFFRSQAYGQKNSLRKILWIQPTIVNSENNATAEPKDYSVY